MQHRFLGNEGKYPLDFVFTREPQYYGYSEGECDPWDGCLRRRNVLKNVVFNIIREIRVIKAKPKLTDILNFVKS